MKILCKLKKAICRPSVISNKIWWLLTKCGFYNGWSDEKYLRYRYKQRVHKNLNLDNPSLFTEKLQWLKINDRNSLYTKMVDKFEAKSFIEDKVGKKYVIPTYGIYDKFDDIDFSSLPNSFILKCTHNSGGIVICKNKEELNIDEARKKINKCLQYNHYYTSREWPYKNVKPRIIAEEFLTNDDNSEVVEYNFFCFNGVPKLVMCCLGDKRVKRYNDFYDMDFNKLDLKCEYSNSDIILEKPKCFDELVNLSKKLSIGLPHLRVDLYVCNDKIYVGELTFFHWGGLCKFEPEDWDKTLGDWLELPYN